jgi:hypothetical protein
MRDEGSIGLVARENKNFAVFLFLAKKNMI